MTDWYVEGRGYSAYGPYSYEDACIIARALAHESDGERSVGLFAHVETAYSRVYDEELPPEPTDDELDGISLPWE